jgi:hypothetical protein
MVPNVAIMLMSTGAVLMRVATNFDCEAIMIEATEKKLREALFFFDALSKESGKILGKDLEVASHYLSAFLSAARSVTFVLQWEEKEKYDAWFPNWSAGIAEEDKKLFGLLLGQRNQALKQGGSAEVNQVIDFIPVTEVQQDRYGHPAYGLHWTGRPGDPPPKVGISKDFFELEGKPIEVTVACKRYVEFLQKLVTDFVASHKK